MDKINDDEMSNVINEIKSRKKGCDYLWSKRSRVDSKDFQSDRG